MAVDFHQVRGDVREAARQAFQDVRSSHPGERFYTFALYSDDDAMTIVPAANSEEALRLRAQKDGYRKIPEYLRWATGEWAYEADGGYYFDTICRSIGGADRYDENKPGAFEAFRASVFETMIEALVDLEAEGFFGRGPERESVTVFCTISDSDDAQELENESARRLNLASVYEAFRQVDGDG